MGDLSRTQTCRCDVVLEQTLGHVTHGQNLRRLLPELPGFEPTFVSVEYDVDGWAARVPGFGNWTVRAGLRARRGLRSLGRHERDAVFVHTQVPAVFLGRATGRVPTIVSLDATPLQYDELGEQYAHSTGPAPVERLKTWLNRRCFERADHLVAWAHWTKRGLVADYGVDAGNVTVIPPGVDISRWGREERAAQRGNEPVRILFVGGNLARKGGDELLAAFGHLRSHHGAGVELHLATPTPLAPIDGVTVHNDMRPNSPELIDLYHRCDVFCLPTRGDCLPMVLPEAGAAGLAMISTDVGAISEIVRDGETGLLVPVGEPEQLHRALERLVSDAELRIRLAGNGSALIRAEHDAAANAARLGELICDVVASRAEHGTGRARSERWTR